MSMTRKGFLRGLFAVSVAVVTAPLAALVPKKEIGWYYAEYKYFPTPPPGWIGNSVMFIHQQLPPRFKENVS